MTDSESDCTVLGDNPPITKRTGVSGGMVPHSRGDGGPSMTTWPLDPPIPELAIDISGLPVLERAPSGMDSVGTLRQYFSHMTLGFGVLKWAFGGMTRFSIIRQTLAREARKAVDSK